MTAGFQAIGLEISDGNEGEIATGPLEFVFPRGQLSLIVGQAETHGRAVLYALNEALSQIIPRASLKGRLLFNEAQI